MIRNDVEIVGRAGGEALAIVAEDWMAIDAAGWLPAPVAVIWMAAAGAVCAALRTAPGGGASARQSVARLEQFGSGGANVRMC